MIVDLIRMTKDPLDLIKMAYGVCKNTDTISVDTIQWLINADPPHESPLEHASATFMISGISRACSHQLVRHRLASFSQLSMRYVNQSTQYNAMPNMDYLATPERLEAELAMDRAFDHSRKAYDGLVEFGVREEDARAILPIATTTKLMMTANFREWRHIIRLRTHKSAQAEIRQVAHDIERILHQYVPEIF